MPTPKLPKTWTKLQTSRLAMPGYYIISYGVEADLHGPLSKEDFVYVGQGKCEYTRLLNVDYCGLTWTTLAWNSAPTRKGVEEASKLAPTVKGYRFQYFDTFEKLDAHLKLRLFPYVLTKASTDTEIPGPEIKPTGIELKGDPFI